MSNDFLQLTAQGQNDWWRYCLGTALTLFLFIFGSALTVGLFVLYVQNDVNPATGLADAEAIAAGASPFVGVPPLVLYIVYNLAFPFFLQGICFSLKLFHNRELQSLITPYAHINWQRIGQGFGVFFLLKFLEILGGYILSPENFTWNFHLSSFLAFLPLICLLTPLQTTTEELLFRGYLLQGIGHGFGKWPAMILSSLLFALLHLSNPEVTTQDSWQGVASLAAYYFMVAVFLAWLTLKAHTLELALGVHAANNMATFLLLTSDNSVIPSPSIFNVDVLEANFSLVFFSAVCLLVFAFIIFRVLKQPDLIDRLG